MTIRVRGTEVKIIRGDITAQDTDAIVNAANSSLMGGGGVDGAIHRRGGVAVKEECIRIRKELWPDGLPPGEAVITKGGNLLASTVIHTVGPIWRGGTHDEEKILESCYLNSLKLADARELHSISFPSISTGAYGFPINRACRIAISVVKRYLDSHDSNITELRFVLFSNSDYELYSKVSEEMFDT